MPKTSIKTDTAREELSRKERYKKTQEAIKKRAEQFGNKSANLSELDELCREIIKETPALKDHLAVPDFVSLSHKEIQEHLNLHASEWKDLWKNFKSVQGDEKDEIKEEAQEILEKLEALIKKCFTDHPPLEVESFKKYFAAQISIASDEKKENQGSITVRSSGIEDSVDCAMPGAYLTVPSVDPDQQSISEAIGEVISSYFSPNALSQRLLMGDDITRDPFIPAFWQKRIGEKINGEKLSANVVRSGIMYTNKSGNRIQVAPGHGELIANSKSSFDSYLITRGKVIHRELSREKRYRMVPIRQIEAIEEKGRPKNKINLIMQKNSRELMLSQSLPDHILMRIAYVGDKIEEHYGMPMDVEFVYEPETDKLYLVQARPIQKPDLAIVPSSVPPDKLAELKTAIEKKEADRLTNLMVVTPARFAAKVITKKEEILICQTIEEAHSRYLKKPKSVKAVVILEPSPDTSHEAALFSSKAIPVIRVQDLKKIEEWIETPKPVLIVDPQRSQIINWSNKIKDHSHAVEEVFSESSGILKQGIYKAPTPPESPMNFNFFRPGYDAMIKNLEIKKEKIADTKEGFDFNKIGKLIQDAQAKDVELSSHAMHDLSELLYKIVAEMPKRSSKILYTDMIKNLEIIEGAKPGKENKEAFDAIQIILAGFFQFIEKKQVDEKRKEPYIALFRQALVNSAEIIACLNHYSSLDSSSESKVESEEMQAELLGLVARLESLISNPGNKEMLTHSILQVMQHENEYSQLLLEEKKSSKKKKRPALLNSPELKDDIKKLDKEHQDILIESLKMQKLLLNNDLKEKWVVFCVRACQNKKTAKRLSELVRYAHNNGIASDLMNISFPSHLDQIAKKWASEEKDQKQTKQEVENLWMKRVLYSLNYEQIIITKQINRFNFTKIQSILTSFERLIPEWGNPKKFDSLWKDFEKELLPLIDQLNVSPGLEPLAQKTLFKLVLQLTEIIDRSIKSLKGSPSYKESDSELLVQRFVKMLEPYQKLMYKWVNLVPNIKFSIWSSKVTDDAEQSNTKQGMCKHIAEVFTALKRTLASDQPSLSDSSTENRTDFIASQLNPSREFNVSSARIDSGASFSRQFVELQDSLTCEDLFSLFHQNILASIAVLSEDVQIKTENLPGSIKKIVDKIDEDFFSTLKMQLLSIDHQYPKLVLEYNMPLRNHSAKFIFEYDQETEKMNIKSKFFGHNGGGRMDWIADLVDIESQLLHLTLRKKPQYSRETRILEFEWEYDTNTSPHMSTHLINNLYMYGKMTLSNRNSAMALDIHANFVKSYLDNPKFLVRFKEIIKRRSGTSSIDTSLWHAAILKATAKYRYEVKEYEKYESVMVDLNSLLNQLTLKECLDALARLNKDSNGAFLHVTKFEHVFDFNHRDNEGTSILEKLVILNLNPDDFFNIIHRNGIQIEDHPNIKLEQLTQYHPHLMKQAIDTKNYTQITKLMQLKAELPSNLEQNLAKDLLLYAFEKNDVLLIKNLVEKHISLSEIGEKPNQKKYSGELSPIWKKIFNTQELHFLFDEKYFNLSYSEDLEIFAKKNIKLILILLDKNPEIVNFHNPNVLSFCKNKKEIEEILSHPNFKFPSINEIFTHPNFKLPSEEKRTEFLEDSQMPTSTTTRIPDDIIHKLLDTEMYKLAVNKGLDINVDTPYPLI